MMTARASTLIERAALFTGYTRAELLGGSRAHGLAHTRQAVYVAMRLACGYSLPKIGRIMGRDHTTILHGLAAVKDRNDPDEAVLITAIVTGVCKGPTAQLTSDIPAPAPLEYRKFPWPQMQVNDSAYIECHGSKSARDSARVSASKWAKGTAKKLVSRAENTGLRVWRVA